ncbi:MAG TPA: protein translocase subunit SecD [Spirochaetota bacterium]|nr:protein translocase subunit SecD [Spirochaetota bacterium]HPC41655.1 protein translocase subunit SecD [Spirochaetota bacterium]HQF09320.1 protein translocase subunit SecD [Spirochaetota bacterium]HQH98268.1 protein translocase subunit SecD [Spirochaetota bacterium]HQJ70427.1 protein translocase subunit SecD [Spirochaetota bacterium]
MTRGMIYKLIFILLLIAFAIVLILPTVGENTMQVSMNGDATAEQYEAVKKKFPSGAYIVTQKGAELTITGRNLNDAVMNDVRTFPGVRTSVIRKHWAEDLVMAKKINLGLDLQGGMHLVLQADFAKIESKSVDKKKLTEKEKSELTQQALELIRNRIDKFGVAEPSIRPRGNEAIEIQLPGVKDPRAVKKAIGTTGQVEYRLVDDEYTAKAGEWLRRNYKEKALPEEPEKQDKLLADITEGIQLPNNREVLYHWERQKDSKKIIPQYPIVLMREVAIAGTDINKAWIGNDEYGGLAVHFTTTAEGATKFADVTAKKNWGKKLAIVIDDKVRSAPRLNVQITSGSAMINGNFTYEEVNTLTRIIKEGALPVDLNIIEERTVGPSLGQDSIEAGVKAAILGFIGILVFMAMYYRLAGVIAGVGLVLNAIFQMAILSWLGFTLTLPGIAGIILTAGMAVDANVLIYERMKEELANGKSVRMAVSMGFDRAFWAIFDGNLTTLISAFVLAQFGTGPIKGFAVTLTIGLIVSMFVALYITRFVYELISLNKKIKRLSI